MKATGIFLILLVAAPTAGAPPPGSVSQPVVRVISGTSIPVVRTAKGITTMISLPEEAREAICGDLYDPQNHAGSFVIQRSGRDLFVKPLRSSATSNLFVKTDRSTYAFDLVVVPAAAAMRIVYVDEATPCVDVRSASEKPDPNP